jgi:hypothetical protein
MRALTAARVQLSVPCILPLVTMIADARRVGTWWMAQEDTAAATLHSPVSPMMPSSSVLSARYAVHHQSIRR